MHNAQELLTKINWFLEPISNFILYLFTTKTGFLILVLSLIVYLLLSTIDAIRVRQLTYKAATNFTSGGISIVEKIYIFGRTILRTFTKIIGNAPVLIIVFLLMFFIVGISTGLSTIDEFVENQNKIKELNIVLKHLDKRQKVAEIDIINVDYVTFETTMKIKFFDYASNDFHNEEQNIIIKGTDIYLDAIVMNFEYTEIDNGKKYNIALPYRLFSNMVSQSEGILLNCKDTKKIPLTFKRNKEDIYGISAEKYNMYIEQFSVYMNDEEKAREAGVRSIIGNAVHKKIQKGQILTIWIEQTGGIVIKEEEEF